MAGSAPSGERDKTAPGLVIRVWGGGVTKVRAFKKQPKA